MRDKNPDVDVTGINKVKAVVFVLGLGDDETAMLSWVERIKNIINAHLTANGLRNTNEVSLSVFTGPSWPKVEMPEIIVSCNSKVVGLSIENAMVCLRLCSNDAPGLVNILPKHDEFQQSAASSAV